MKQCRWCEELTSGTIIIERRRSTISTNTIGNMRQSVRADVLVPCCESCKSKIIRSKSPLRDDAPPEGIQMDVYDVLDEMGK